MSTWWVLLLLAWPGWAAMVTISPENQGWEVGSGGLWTGIFRRETRALQRGGGGTIVVRSGIYPSGGFSLFDNTVLHLEEGAVIVASDNATEYYCIPSITWDTNVRCDYALVNVVNASNVTITGKGTLEGGANSPPGHLVKMYDKENNFLVPRDIPLPYCTPFNCRIKLVVFLNCSSVLIEGVHLLHSPFWTLQFGLSDDIQVRSVHIEGDRRWPNGDGIDVVSSTNVEVSHCFISTGDDCIDISTHVMGAESANISIHDNTLLSTSCAQNIGIFAVSSISNVSWTNNQVRDSNRAMAIMPRIGGGNITNIVYRGIKASTRFFSPAWWGSAEPITISALPFNTTLPYTGTISNVRFHDVFAYSNNGVTVRSERFDQIAGLRFSNVTINLAVFGNITRPCKDWRPWGDDTPIPSDTDGFFFEGLKLGAVTLSGSAVVFGGPREPWWGVCLNTTLSAPVMNSTAALKCVVSSMIASPRLLMDPSY